MALLSIRADRFWKKTGKKISIQGTDVTSGIELELYGDDEENHALVADEEAPTEFSLMAKTSAESEVFDSSLCSKAWLAQVEARLAEHRSQELKYCKKIRVLEFQTESSADCIERPRQPSKESKIGQEQGGIRIQCGSSPSYSNLLSSQEGHAWTGLPKFADDIITDYSRPSPTIESNTDDTNRNSSVTETRESSNIITSKPAIKFVKA
nr:hypothetical protein [Tanacetum cinerariifolium]